MKTPSLVLTVALTAALAGCAGPSRVAEHHGQAQRANRDAMIENPIPTPLNTQGLDPRSAEHVLEGYSRGQEAQSHRRDRTLSGEID